MLRTLEAVIDADGRVKFKEPLRLGCSHRAIVTILEQVEEEDTGVSETALLSEQALAADWNREEEDEAWSHLQQDQ